MERDVVWRNPPQVSRGQIGGLRLALLGYTHPTRSRIPLDPDEVYHALCMALIERKTSPGWALLSSVAGLAANAGKFVDLICGCCLPSCLAETG